MCPTIRIDDEVFALLQEQAEPFKDTPNSVLRRLLGLTEKQISQPLGKRRPKTVVGRKTPQAAFRAPILRALMEHGGRSERLTVLKEVERRMRHTLTEFDCADIKSGALRWQKSAEWEVRVMREEGLLKAVHETARGVWELTSKGRDVAQQSLQSE